MVQPRSCSPTLRYGVSIPFLHTHTLCLQIPQNPPPPVESERNAVNQTLLTKLVEVYALVYTPVFDHADFYQRFKERPIWTRTSLLNQFTSAEARDILKYRPFTLTCYHHLAEHHFPSSKPLLPLVCYVFQDGPWRDTLVRFQFDPRKEPEARLCVYILCRIGGLC